MVDLYRVFMNGVISILECITDIKNKDSESMRSRYSNVYYKGVNIFQWAVGLIKINYLNLRTPICTVPGNKYIRIITAAFHNTWRNK